MDIFPILFDAQLILLVGVLVAWALYKPRRRQHRRQEGIRCTDGKIVGGMTPAMSAEEVIAICNSIPFADKRRNSQ